MGRFGGPRPRWEWPPWQDQVSGGNTAPRVRPGGALEGGGRMDVCLIGDRGIEERPVEELAALLARQDGLVWVDIPR
jgi:hypothetical protein